MAKSVSKNPSPFSDISASIADAAAIKNCKNVLSTLPEVINFYHRAKRLYHGKFFDFIPSKWNKKQTDDNIVNHLIITKLILNKD